jgi:hypothetical protein
MRAARQPAQHIFGPDDRERKGAQGPVQGRHQQNSARLEHALAGGQEGRDIGHMLDHFHGKHGIEAFALRGESLDGRLSIVDREPRTLGVGLGDLDVLARGIDARDLRAQARERLAEKPSAAADVEHSMPREDAPLARIKAEMTRCLTPDPG